MDAVRANPKELPVTFLPVRGKGREDRMELVRNFLENNRDFLYGSQTNTIDDIKNGTLKCRLVALEDSRKSLGCFIFKNQLYDMSICGNSVAKTVKITAFAALNREDEQEIMSKYADAMFREIVELSRDLRPSSFTVELHKTAAAAIAFFKTKDFSLVSEGDFNWLFKTCSKPFSASVDKPVKSNEHEVKMQEEPSTKKRTREGDNWSSATDRIKRGKEIPVRTVQSKAVAATLKKMYIHQIRDGRKTIEGRIDSGMFKNLRVGSRMRFFYFQDAQDDVYCTVTKINRYKSFREMISKENYKACLPEARSQEDAISLYDSIPGYREKAQANGVLAIHIKKD